MSVPHTVELMPAEASGCRNYQGVAWYRKHFVIPQDMKGKEVSLHFEGAMGKQVIYLNGKRVQEHLGRIPSFHCATDGTGGTARRQLLAGSDDR